MFARIPPDVSLPVALWNDDAPNPPSLETIKTLVTTQVVCAGRSNCREGKGGGGCDDDDFINQFRHFTYLTRFETVHIAIHAITVPTFFINVLQ